MSAVTDCLAGPQSTGLSKLSRQAERDEFGEHSDVQYGTVYMLIYTVDLTFHFDCKNCSYTRSTWLSILIARMGRPKVSEGNMRLALAFSDILIRRDKADASNSHVDRKGPHSLFAAFCACFPELTRNSCDKHPKNRQGLSMIELNKALKSTGMRCTRKREYSRHGVRWLCKVHCTINNDGMFVMELNA